MRFITYTYKNTTSWEAINDKGVVDLGAKMGGIGVLSNGIIDEPIEE